MSAITKILTASEGGKVFWRLPAVLSVVLLWLSSDASFSWAEDELRPTVISLDYCADQYVLALADREQIVGLSRQSEKSYSFYANEAHGLPKLYGTIDEVIYHEPDVIVRTWGTSDRLIELARAQGIGTVVTDYGSGLDIVVGNVGLIGSAIHQNERATQLAKDYAARLTALQTLPKLPLRAAYVTPSGFTSGMNTFVDEIIELAGLESWAATRGISGWQMLPVEGIIVDPPDVVVTSFFDMPMASRSRWSTSRHRRLYRLMSDKISIDLPGSYLSCNGLFLTAAAERIRQELDNHLQEKTMGGTEE